MTDHDERSDNTDGEGTPSFGGDIVGPGVGGSPTAAGTSGEFARNDETDDPEVEQMIQNLRADAEDFEVRADEAAEQAGTGTDA